MGYTFFITTPLYYVNDEPHIGHAYCTILADVVARYHRLFGDEVFFLTGTDEHGQKNYEAAQKRGLDPRTHCDQMAQRYLDLWEKLDIRNDDFIRTTEERHKRVVVHILQDLYERDEIYRAEYQGWYCVPCERFWQEKDLIEGNCPDCGREVSELSETNYFFRMGRYQDWLRQYIEDHPTFILPEMRRNEILGFLRNPLGDLCISRPKERLPWGIELPFDPDYVSYVWFDALINYIVAPGYLVDEERFDHLWPATYHLIGKDILTTHSVYWPTMLKAIGIEMPQTIFGHGWWLIAETKISKSIGNVVRPVEEIEQYGVDQFRYFLMREMAPGQDANYSDEAVIRRVNADLANDLGNMANRVLTMIHRYLGARVPAQGSLEGVDTRLVEQALQVPQRCRDQIDGMRINGAVEEVIQLVRAVNRYLEETAPWSLAKGRQEERLATVLRTAAETLFKVAVILDPIMPAKCGLLRGYLGMPIATDQLSWDLVSRWEILPEGTTTAKGDPLFPRIEAA
jgi:methionyl-tRNA synthetase